MSPTKQMVEAINRAIAKAWTLDYDLDQTIEYVRANVKPHPERGVLEYSWELIQYVEGKLDIMSLEYCLYARINGQRGNQRSTPIPADENEFIAYLKGAMV